MANSSSRIRIPDSLRVTQPTLSKKMWMGSLQQRTVVALAFPVPGGQHCCPSPQWTSAQLRRAWHTETRHNDRKVPVAGPIRSGVPPGRLLSSSCAPITCSSSSRGAGLRSGTAGGGGGGDPVSPALQYRSSNRVLLYRGCCSFFVLFIVLGSVLDVRSRNWR
uniref:Uncharacterized protein n=1 Tax=Gadus morhua TaxID=8049 RepID=A0A8C5FEG2_GADMO